MKALSILRTVLMVSMIITADPSHAHELKVNLVNPRATEKEEQAVSNLVGSLQTLFPFLATASPLVINLCGKGGPACFPENSYRVEANTINLEIFASPLVNPDRLNDFHITKTTLAHEYGHYVFMERAIGINDSYKTLVEALKYIESQERKLYEAKASKNDEVAREIETELQNERETISTARQLYLVSLFYQEVFSDFLAAVYFNDPNTVCLAAEGTPTCSLDEVKVRQFSASPSFQEVQRLVEENRLGQQHVGLATSRKALWEKYKDLTRVGKTKSEVLNSILDVFITESGKVMFGADNYDLERMNLDLVEAIRLLSLAPSN